jgi:carbamoyl-phosphate synthase large subunit
MKSVGEAMAIGRTFHESMQKALASMETGLTGFDEIDIPGAPDPAAITKALSRQTPDRIRHHRPGDAPRAERRRASPPSPASTRGSSPASARSSRPRTGAPRRPAGDRGRAPRLKMMGFTDARLAR